MLFPDNNVINFMAISFTALIVIEYLNIYTEVDKCHWIMFLSAILSFAMYLTSLLIFPAYFNFDTIFSAYFLLRLLIIVVFGWVPIFVTDKCMKRID